MRTAIDWKRSRSPDWFEYCFINEKFVACGEFSLVRETAFEVGEPVSV
jgi:hypothetical protein